MTWAITGVGLVSSLGHDSASSLDAFAAGATSVQPLQAFDHTRYRVTNAYELDGQGGDTAGRAGRWLGEAVTEALKGAGLTAPLAAHAGAARDVSALDIRMPVIVGTGLAEQRSLELWCVGRAATSLDELHFARAIERATGLPHTMTIVNACSASLYALAVATDLLALDEADAVVVAGTDGLSESMFGMLDRVNARPPTEVRPFDVDRQGVILGEGAAAIVLEPLWRAADRGVVPLALIRGVGTTCDAHHVTAPLRSGIVAAFRSAHQRAGITPDAIDLVLAHGTGTMLNDQTEAEALSEVFAEAARKPMVTALKSLIGHTSGASGLMSLITAVEALNTGRVPPTRHHVTPIEPIRDFPLVTVPTQLSGLDTAQVNAFGFGGVNAVAVVSRNSPVSSPMLEPRDVVVTGVGIEIPGVSSIAELLGEPHPSGEFDPAATLGERGLRYKDRATLLGLCAATHALRDAGFTQQPDKDFGVIVATELALVESVCRVVSTIHEHNVAHCSPMDLPNVSGNVAAAQIAIWFKLAGLNLTLSAGASSGVDALHYAATAIRAGRAERMLVIGVEPNEPAVARLMAETARRHGDSPARLFDGAAAVVLEAAPPVGREERSAAEPRSGGTHDPVGREERSAAEPRSGGTHHAAKAYAQIGRYTRTLEPVTPVGPSLSPCGEHHDRRSPSLSNVVGEASAALGVLQCAVAATQLREEAITIQAGGCWGSAYASLRLEVPR